MQSQLTGIDRGKEVPSDQKREAQRRDREQGKGSEHEPAMVERPIQQARIAEAKIFELPVEDIMNAPEEAPAAGRMAVLALLVQRDLAFEQIMHHGRNQ